MTLSRLPGQLLLVALAVIPPAALIVGSVVDVGPDGFPRTTAVHIGLAIADPIVRESARNSLLAAGLGTFLALALGVSLGHPLGRWSFWGRKPLAILVYSGLAMTPLIASLGGRAVVDACAGLADNPTDRIAVGGWGSAIAWILAVGLSGAPWVALAVRDALTEIPLSSVEAAQQRGMSRRRASRRLIWPLIRPSAALAAAGVFARAIGDPGPPLILGLRRSLAFQVYDALRLPEALPRASVLGVLALVIAAVGSVLLRWWGGTDWLASATVGKDAGSAPVPRWSLPKLAGLLAGGLLILSPLIGLLLDAWKANHSPSLDDLAVWLTADAILLITRSAAGAVLVGLSLLILVAWSGSGSAELHLRSLVRGLIAIGPAPIVLGVVILRADGPFWLQGLGLRWPVNPWSPTLLDPAVLLATVSALLPMVILWAAAPPIAPGDAASRRARVEAARLAGQSPSMARSLARAIAPRSIALPGWLLAIAMAATTTSTTLIPTTTTTPATLSAAIVRQANQPPTDPVPILPAITFTIALTGVAAASGSRPSRLGKLARQGIGPV